MFEIILFLFFISPVIVILAFGFLVGFNGYKKHNGHSDFVNSARIIDRK